MIRSRSVRAFTMIELMIAIVIISILAAITLSIGSAVLESADRRKTQDVLSLLDSAMTEYQQHTGRTMTYGQGDRGGQVYDDKPLNEISGYDLPVSGIYSQDQPDGIGFLEDFSVSPDNFGSWETAMSKRAGRRLMREVLARLESVESCRTILAKIGPSFWDEVGSGGSAAELTLVDAWGRPIIVVFPGRTWFTNHVDVAMQDMEDPGDPETARRDHDDTIRTYEERSFGPARGDRVYFMSAGPDQRYGHVNYQIAQGETFVPDQDDVRYRRTEDNLYSYEVRQW